MPGLGVEKFSIKNCELQKSENNDMETDIDVVLSFILENLRDNMWHSDPELKKNILQWITQHLYEICSP